jgi:hypothetical protein
MVTGVLGRAGRLEGVLDVFGLLLLADTTTHAANLSIFSPASPPAESIRSLFILVLEVTAAIFLLVEGVLLYSIVRFRRPSPEDAEPPQVYGSMPIEIAGTVAPSQLLTPGAKSCEDSGPCAESKPGWERGFEPGQRSHAARIVL